ncbi:hypothetical protein GCM10009537_02960 [Corynebacterium riegelii]
MVKLLAVGKRALSAFFTHSLNNRRHRWQHRGNINATARHEAAQLRSSWSLVPEIGHMQHLSKSIPVSSAAGLNSPTWVGIGEREGD